MLTTMDFDSFPGLTPRAQDVIAEAQTKHSTLEQQAKALKALQWVFGVAFFCALLVGVAVAVNSNEALLHNVREELTTADWLLRLSAALGMELAIIAGIWGIHTAFNSDDPVPVRVTGCILGLVVLVATFFSASSIGYSKFGGLLDTLWNGFNGSNSLISFEAGAQTGPAVDIPFIFRLTSSALFIGAGLLAGFMEYAWLQTRKRMAETREQLAKYGVALDIHHKYEAARDEFFKQKAEKSKLEDTAFRHSRAHTVVLNGVASYRKEVEAQRPPPIRPALVDRPTYERHRTDTEKTEDCLRSADKIMSQMDKILAIIAKLFPTDESQTIDAKGLKDVFASSEKANAPEDSPVDKKE